ncbi:MAG: hypothetical protein GC206_07345 [Alphaproteobacteria bacterium]|nr:hypothetical protein [Alphaproteobacteria bacterium]
MIAALMVDWPFLGSAEGAAPPAVAPTPIEIVTLSDIANSRAQAPPEPEEETLEENEEAEVQPAAAAPPPSAPTPRPDQPLRLGDIEDRLKGPGAPRPNPATAPGPRRPQVGDGSRESQTIASRVAALTQRHMVGCWRSSIDASDPGRLRVVLQFRLDPRGRLDGNPRVLSPRSVAGDPELRVAVERAVRAVRDCSPFPFPDDALVGEHYDFWRENVYRFGADLN